MDNKKIEQVVELERIEHDDGSIAYEWHGDIDLYKDTEETIDSPTFIKIEGVRAKEYADTINEALKSHTEILQGNGPALANCDAIQNIHPDLEPVLETIRAALQALPVEKAREADQSFAAQAYIVIGNIVGNLEIDSSQIQGALDYFSAEKYDEDFLPWDGGVEKSGEK